MSKILEVLDPEAGFGIDAIGDQTVDKGSDGGKLYLDTSSFEITLSYLIIKSKICSRLFLISLIYY